MTVIVLLLFFSAILFDWRTLLKGAEKREKAVYFSMMTVSFGLLLLYSLDVTLPPPMDVIENALEALLHLKE